MITPKIKPFIEKVTDKTNTQEIKWEEGSTDSYVSIVKDANLYIKHYSDNDTGDYGFIFRMDRGDNQVSFSVSYTEEDDYRIMNNLYSSVSLNSAGGEDFFNDLLDE